MHSGRVRGICQSGILLQFISLRRQSGHVSVYKRSFAAIPSQAARAQALFLTGAGLEALELLEVEAAPDDRKARHVREQRRPASHLRSAQQGTSLA